MDFLTSASPYQWLLAFVVMAVTDVCWAMYTIATAQNKKPLHASAWAVALFLLGGLAVVGYTTAPILLLPSAVGAFVGTYAGVVLSKRKERP
jgi:hypothetical protein